MLNVLISSDSRYPVNRKVIKKAVADVFTREGIESLDAEVSVLVCGFRKMNDLTKKYLNDGREHEVLSFPLEAGRKVVDKNPDTVLRLGDVIISWPKVLELAAAENIYADEKLAFLVGHGVEHLLGKHHEE